MKDLTHEEQTGLYLGQPAVRQERFSPININCKDDIQKQLCSLTNIYIYIHIYIYMHT
jgi:hypothetical protein